MHLHLLLRGGITEIFLQLKAIPFLVCRHLKERDSAGIQSPHELHDDSMNNRRRIVLQNDDRIDHINIGETREIINIGHLVKMDIRYLFVLEIFSGDL